MPSVEGFTPQGMLHEGWSAEVEAYAIVCGWILGGKALFVGDVAGGLYLFEGNLEPPFGRKKRSIKEAY